MSTSRQQARQNSSDNVFSGIPTGEKEEALFDQFLQSHDFSKNSRRAMVQDMKKFARWFFEANKEPFVIGRTTTRDIIDYRNWLRRDRCQAVATVNRALITIRRFFGWLVEQGHTESNPAKAVKELQRVQLAPKGLDRTEVRKLLREIELRQDTRAGAIFSLFLYSGCRVSDLVELDLDDLMISERSGSVVFRHGKGNKHRSVPLPLPARKALQEYLACRPPVRSRKLFIGERGALTDRGIRSLCDKYSAFIRIKIHPHLLRHTMAHQYLVDNPGDLVGLAQILGHSDINTTKRYVQQTEEQLFEAVGRMVY